jgi:MinD-like ATPase involved in chromosome partitioning or flagellar assembly
MVCKKITFYSYKGGVGRSLALVNVASALAQSGKNVACLDYDIEAPGLHNFFKLSNESIESGLLELLRSGDISNIREYILSERELGMEFEGNLYLLPSEPDIEKLKNITFDTETSTGSQTFADAKDIPGRIGELFSLDYVFIDARTGYTDPTIVSLLAADVIVVLFRFNRQNLGGIKDLIKKSKMFLQDRKLVFCASPIPETDSTNEKIRDFEEELGITISFVIPYDPELEFEEKISVVDMPDSSSAKKYKELADLMEKL